MHVIALPFASSPRHRVTPRVPTAMGRRLRAPRIDLASLLAEDNPQIDLKLEAFEKTNRDFVKALGEHKMRYITAMAERREQAEAEKKRLAERMRAAEAETNQCKLKEIELLAGACVVVVMGGG